MLSEENIFQISAVRMGVCAYMDATLLFPSEPGAGREKVKLCKLSKINGQKEERYWREERENFKDNCGGVVSSLLKRSVSRHAKEKRDCTQSISS